MWCHLCMKQPLVALNHSAGSPQTYLRSKATRNRKIHVDHCFLFLHSGRDRRDWLSRGAFGRRSGGAAAWRGLLSSPLGREVNIILPEWLHSAFFLSLRWVLPHRFSVSVFVWGAVSVSPRPWLLWWISGHVASGWVCKVTFWACSLGFVEWWSWCIGLRMWLLLLMWLLFTPFY